MEALLKDLETGVDGEAAAEQAFSPWARLGKPLAIVRPRLGVSRSPVELAVMRTLKDALDPKHVLNPGKQSVGRCVRKIAFAV
jgi:hypothetical protein